MFPCTIRITRLKHPLHPCVEERDYLSSSSWENCHAQIGFDWRDCHRCRSAFGQPNFCPMVGRKEPIRVCGQGVCGRWKASDARKRSWRSPEAFTAGGPALRGGRDLPPVLVASVKELVVFF
jgi:hypothetical protein